MFNKNKIRSMEDNIDDLYGKVRWVREKVDGIDFLLKEVISGNKLRAEELSRKLDTLRDLSVNSDKLFSDMITDVDRKYKAAFTLILDYLKLELNLNEDGEMYVEARSKVHNKTKTKTAKVGKKNSSVRGKTSRKRK